MLGFGGEGPGVHEVRAREDIQDTIAKQIKKVVGVEVEVTAMPDPTNWTISGLTADVIAAVIYLEDRKLMKMKNSVLNSVDDDELVIPQQAYGVPV